MMKFILINKQLRFMLLLTCLFGLLIIPGLNNIHYDPLPQYWAEIHFVIAVLALFTIVCFLYRQIFLPQINFWLLAFAIYLCLQQFIVKIDFVGLSYIAALECMILILLSISISTIIYYEGFSTFLKLIIIALIIGGILQSMIGFIQYNNWHHYFADLIFYDSAHPDTNIFGHFGQRNHYCHYLSWVVFSLIYCYHKKIIRAYYFWPLLLWFIFSITIASSRSVFLYFAFACIISIVNVIINRKRDNYQLFLLIISVTLLLIVGEYLYPLLHSLFNHSHQLSSGLDRLIANNASASDIAGRRLVEWQKAWLVFTHCYIFGYGFNEYAKQSVYLQFIFPHAATNDGLFTNCHNFILQLLAETGIVGTLIVSGGVISGIYALLRRNNTEAVIVLCILSTTLIHSMLEYPLWYIYFLGPCLIFLSCEQLPKYCCNSKLLFIICFLPLLWLIYLMISGSSIYNKLVDYAETPSQTQQFTKQVQYLEQMIANNALWRYPALYDLDSYITVNNANTNNNFSYAAQLYYENMFSDFRPYPENIIKQAMLNWNMGNKKAAQFYLHLALVAYPNYRSTFINMLKAKQYNQLLIYGLNK